MKSIVILLLLVLFFVSGMLFGVKNETDITAPDLSPETKVETIDASEVTPITDGSSINEGETYKQAPVHFTQKMASFIEGIVKGFYEIIVQLLYQVVQLFY